MVPWCDSMKWMSGLGRLYSLAISTPFLTCPTMMSRLIAGDRLLCLFGPPAWFSIKYCGLLIFPMSWYMAPTLQSSPFAPMAMAASSAMSASLSECWYVPGASCASLRSSGCEASLSSLSVIAVDTRNTFSMAGSRPWVTSPVNIAATRTTSASLKMSVI